MRKERNLKVRKILAVLVSVACMIPLYVVLHEGGHALVAVMCGARITKFSILGAYMNYEGGQFSAAVFSLFPCSGDAAAASCGHPLYDRVSKWGKVYPLQDLLLFSSVAACRGGAGMGGCPDFLPGRL